ncbi:uncharacterized protein LOC118647643 isoform X3 [Monomorium pharaonis]|uniref:uncharacterized protein LOC118647643 isoform X3 n=1 Tax=Monomorium pharaonis TaxID=307658 RepID=UPI001745F39B|nr:uncharacterized protein LOC118647643 isoform X3 [Monomorium pharaonis]
MPLMFTQKAENDITIDNMKDLTEDHLKELKISIGHRILLKNKIKRFMEEKENINTQNLLDMELIFEQSNVNEIETSGTNTIIEAGTELSTEPNTEPSTDNESYEVYTCTRK